MEFNAKHTIDIHNAFENKVSSVYEKQLQELRTRITELETIVETNQQSMNVMIAGSRVNCRKWFKNKIKLFKITIQVQFEWFILIPVNPLFMKLLNIVKLSIAYDK